MLVDKNSVNERAPFPRVYASLVASLGGNEKLIRILWIARNHRSLKTAEGKNLEKILLFRSVLKLLKNIWAQIATTVLFIKYLPFY